MIFGKPAASAPGSLAQRLGRCVFVELPVWQLLLLAGAIGVLWAAGLFDWSFVLGQQAFWQFPKGTIGDSRFDMVETLSAYLYYVQSPWNIPLFYVSALGTPTGTNILFMDAVPIVALTGKVIYSLSGATANLYGAYLFGCFALPGVMMALVLIASGLRSALATVIGALFANAMPALLWRWGHIALEGQFLLVGALALYLFSLQKRPWRGLAGSWIAYLALAYLVNIYLFAMVGAVWFCAIVQRRADGLMTTREALKTGALSLAVLTGVIALSGQFGSGTGLPFAKYGIYSMNLLSPFVPQGSGLLPGLGGVIDATGSQYEGFNYLGLGLLFNVIVMLPAEASWLRRSLKRHVALLLAFAALTAFAISHRVFAGNTMLFELPMPLYLNAGFGIFRSSGRFFWLIGYALVALTIILGFRTGRPVVALCLAVGAILQLIDVQPLRHRIIASIAAGPSAQELDHDQVARLVAGARLIEVIPSFQCTADERQLQANVELMLAAARANVPTNTVYLARQTYGLTLSELMRAPSRAQEMRDAHRKAFCKQEGAQVQLGGSPGEVFVLFSDPSAQAPVAPDITCSPLSWARYCKSTK